MRIRKWVGIGFTIIVMQGCGDELLNLPPTPAPPAAPAISTYNSPTPHLNGEVVLPVVGTASFGSQCPHGFIAPPQSTPLEFVTAPIQLTTLELSESLNPIMVQADCKKYTVDIRGLDRSASATTWEFPPSGNISFTLNGGMVHIKNDGAGNLNCTTPTLIEFKGTVDCKDPDYPVIQLQVFWNLGKTLSAIQPVSSPLPTPSGSPAPWPSPSPHPASAPVPWPNPRYWPHFPLTVSSNSTGDPTADSSPSPSASPSPGPSFNPSPAPHVDATCQLTQDAYLQTSEKIIIKQCVY